MTEAERITRELHGHWYGSYGSACCPAHNNTQTPALSLKNGRGGKLLAHCHAGCAFLSILNALRAIGVVAGKGTFITSRISDLASSQAVDEAAVVKRESQALRLWSEALPIAGTPAESYLQGRGISCLLSKTLRFNPSTWHSPSAKHLPAMVALVEGCDRVAVHRTYLQPDGNGKALAAPNKMMLGSTAGGAVRLSKADGPLVVAEGIETALSLASGLIYKPGTVWAALSTSGIRGLHLPDLLGSLTIASDGDKPGREAANALAERAHRLGWHVSFLKAPDGHDWNDILTSKGDLA